MKVSKDNGPFPHTTESLILAWCRANPQEGNPCMRNLAGGLYGVIAVNYMDPERGTLAKSDTWEGVLETLKNKYPQDFE